MTDDWTLTGRINFLLVSVHRQPVRDDDAKTVLPSSATKKKSEKPRARVKVAYKDTERPY